MTAFVDTNILVRHLTGDPPDLAERATAYLGTERELLLTDLAAAETVYVLESFYAAPRERTHRWAVLRSRRAGLAAQDRAFAAFAHGEVDRSRRSWDKRDGGGLVALAENAQRAMATLDGEVFDVRGARFSYSQSVQPQKHR